MSLPLAGPSRRRMCFSRRKHAATFETYGATKVAVAVSTLVPGGSVTFAVAVDDASVPASAVLLNVVRVATPSVTTLTASAVPSGTLLACSATVIGFTVFGSTVTSGTLKYVACGVGGTLTPPIETMRTEGEALSGSTFPGKPCELVVIPPGPKPPVCWKVSKRTRPSPPRNMPAPHPDRTSSKAPLVTMALAMSRIAPPEPQPELTFCARPTLLFTPLPPCAKIPRDTNCTFIVIVPEEAIRIAPPPPPPPGPLLVGPPAPPPPPEPPINGKRVCTP